MGNEKITIELSKGNLDEYIIRDNIGITIGRFYILDMNKEEKNCLVKFKFYREDNKDLMTDVLRALGNKIFSGGDIFKLNIISEENINLSSFLEVGFMLEGIFDSNVYLNGIYKSQYLLGITSIEFNSGNVLSSLSIKGRKVTLNLLTPEYTKEVLEYCIRNKDHLKDFEPLRDESFYTIEVQKRILIENFKQYLNGISMNFGIFKEGKLIGKIQLSNIINGIFKSAFIGYSLDKDEQGHGYMRDAVETIIEYAFYDLGLHRIEASTLINNVRSQNVLKACGFVDLGINKNYLYINGGWEDHITFYKTKED
ncbi:GNAT family N-acetyltransferase [Clostridium sp.]|uniref:GNAT family N-acetyltransferase n=1 Tax=Clostridium sp. TaxID=1506 RepID=UPI003463C885